jgi:hypothetical protein
MINVDKIQKHDCESTGISLNTLKFILEESEHKNGGRRIQYTL